jgi:superfamily II DNA or RNA helicase
METIQEIKTAVSSMSPKELAQFRAWFEEFDAEAWDNQFEQDVMSGKLDAIAEKAIDDFKQGKYKKLCTNKILNEGIVIAN